jgi:hypothetical protein
MVDSVKPDVAKSTISTASTLESAALDPAPKRNQSGERPTRAALESTNAGLRAALGATQVAYERLVLKAETLQVALARGPMQGLHGNSGGMNDRLSTSVGAGEFASCTEG